MTKKLFIAMLVLSTSVAFSQKKVVFIILDGIPADVIERVETPALTAIKAKGGYTRALQGGDRGSYNQSPTISAVGYNNVLTGTWANKHNVWDNDIKAPNYHYWNIFRIAKAAKPELKTAIFSSWTDNRTKLVGEQLPAAGNFKLDYSFDGLELDKKKYPHSDSLYMFKIDEAVSTEAARYILDQGPDLSWVYLEFTDDMGHAFGDGPRFYNSVKKADEQVGRIYQSILEREKHHHEDWMIVVTTDHGRDPNTGKGHGGQTDRERTGWIFTNASSLNQHFKDHASNVDIAPTILQFLNLKAPVEISGELDGVSLIGDVSIADLKCSVNDKRATLSWSAMNPGGEAEIKVAISNNFKNGISDAYTTLGKVAVSAGTFTFDLPDSKDGFYKILIAAPKNNLNIWIVGKK